MLPPDGRDGYAVHAKHTTSASTRIAGQTIRVGWAADDAFGPIDPDINAAVTSAAARLVDLGCRVKRIDPPFLRDTDALTAVMTLFYSQLVRRTQRWSRRPPTPDLASSDDAFVIGRQRTGVYANATMIDGRGTPDWGRASGSTTGVRPGNTPTGCPTRTRSRSISAAWAVSGWTSTRSARRNSGRGPSNGAPPP